MLLQLSVAVKCWEQSVLHGCAILQYCLLDVTSVMNLTSVTKSPSCPVSRRLESCDVQNQHLRGSNMASSESLDVRWANDDPNPKAIARVKRNYEEEYMSAVRHAVNELPPEQKRARLLEMQLYGNVQRGSAVAPYPGKQRTTSVLGILNLRGQIPSMLCNA